MPVTAITPNFFDDKPFYSMWSEFDTNNFSKQIRKVIFTHIISIHMKALFQYCFTILLFVFISCNPDEDLDNNGNSGNNGSIGGGSNAMSYPEVINLLAGNWYGQSMVYYSPNGTELMTYDQTGTMSIGYLTFGSNSIGSVDFNPTSSSIAAPPYVNLLVNKYPASVTITNGSWSGSGWESLTSGLARYATEYNQLSEKSYCVVEFSTPFFNFSTPTIQYGIITRAANLFGDVTIGMYGDEGEAGGYCRIHTLNTTTLKIVEGVEQGYYIMTTYNKQ
jgi:hypothetical protein